ncbi:hypothetical protein [Ralstonia wenshanensis]|uniref:hypothetical protein n=1 Tax=Ralstonia wenshanensis TaxID=2842456 RepID=UPI002AAC6B6E|nr:hypothetical protein [Ralstonia wenshanensis]MDY7507219.1 hypothetical protein [Ralstonia wenshanensis]
MALSTDTQGPFDVRTDDLIHIGATEAVDLFRQLLIIEAMVAGVAVTAVDIPSAITVADGGVDAEVTGMRGTALPGGLISEGLTCYQIKTGGFSASTASDIRSLLVQPRFATGHHKFTKAELQPRVLSCFEKQGTFVVVLFGSDLVGPADDHGATQIREFMAAVDPKFASVKVRIIRANQLCSAISALAPGIALRLNRMQGSDDAPFHDLSFMEDSCGLEIDVYQTTEGLDKAAQQITSAAQELNGFQHIRVLGDAGAGKTHLIYRSLRASQFSGCVIYCKDPEQAMGSTSLATLRVLAPTTTIILVVDDCDFETAEELTALFRRRATRMLLVTADNVAEPASAHVNTQVIEVPRLEKPAIADIFAGYGIPHETAKWLAKLCEGSPRAAHRLGEYIRNNPHEQPAEQLAHLDGLWDRIVCAPHSVDSVDGQDRLAVMRTLALFRQVAWETADGPAAQLAVLSALKLLDDTFSHMRLSRSVSELRRRRVLQGPRVLLISPMLLHVAMWKSWFQHYGNMVDALQLRDRLEARMQQHFDAMLVFARESKAATVWVDNLLGTGGKFASLDSYKAAGDASLFFAIAQAKPKAALRRFAAALGAEPIEIRSQFAGAARRTAVHSLEQLAVAADTFHEAAECLLLLAEAENESWSNNSTGVFVSLFSLGHGPVAASELSPLGKIDYLRKLLHSDIPFRRGVAVRALGKSLDPFMSRTSLEDSVGLRRLPERWQPKTAQEVCDAYEAHIELLEEAASYLPEEEALNAATEILSHVRSLITIGPLSDRIVQFLSRTASMPKLREKCIEAIVSVLHHEGNALPDHVKGELQSLRADLTESSFSNKLRRHAGMKLIEDSFDAEGRYSDAAGPELRQLVSDVLETPTLLEPELAWLVTDAAKNGFQFGQLVGQADDVSLWRAIEEAWLNAGQARSDYFIGGYLSGVHLKDVSQWEGLIEDVFAKEEVHDFAFRLVWRSGMSDRIARALLSMARAGYIELKGFQLFVYGGVVNRLPIDVVQCVVDELLLDDDADAPDAAMDIIDSRLRGHPDELEVLSSLLERTLNSAAFVEGTAHRHPGTMLSFRWNELANRFLELNPTAAAELAVRCIANFANENSITSGFHPDSWKFLCKAAKEMPAVIWPAIAFRLEKQRGEMGTWHLLSWLRGGRSIRGGEEAGLDAIPPSFAFEWIDHDPLDRAWFLAEHCPPVVSGPDEPPTFARQMLERNGAIEQVRRSLHANNFSEGWSGPASDHYRRKLDALEAQLEVETNENVRTWLQEHREMLLASIDREVERELRESEW